MVAAVISGIFVVVVAVMAVVVIVCLKMALHLSGQSHQPRTLQAKLKRQQALPPYTDPALQALVSVTWCLSLVLQPPAQSYAAEMDSTLKGHASATVVGKVQSATYP